MSEITGDPIGAQINIFVLLNNIVTINAIVVSVLKHS